MLQIPRQILKFHKFIVPISRPNGVGLPNSYIVNSGRFASSYTINSRLCCALQFHLRSSSTISQTQRKQFSSSMASTAEGFRHLDYAQLMEVKNKEKCILIDVREKSELDQTGTIPGAYHIPVGEIDAAFSKSDEDFKKAYHFNKPSTDEQIIFSCRSGKRSLMALEKALARGFEKSKHYKGGWLDWEQNADSQ